MAMASDRPHEREWDQGKPPRDVDPRLARDQPPDAREQRQIERRRQREAQPLENFWRRSPSPPRKRYIDEFHDTRNAWQRRMEKKPEEAPPVQGNAVHVAVDSISTADSFEPKVASLPPAVSSEQRDEDPAEAVFGPKPLPKAEVADGKVRYADMLKGEGEAMALFVQQQKRIPRRGEIGLSSAKIESFENSGYVMSGNRNRRMTLARLRKESEVYSVEEKKALEALEQEEKHLKEHRMLADLRALAAEAQRNALNAVAGIPPPPPPPEGHS